MYVLREVAILQGVLNSSVSMYTLYKFGTTLGLSKRASLLISGGISFTPLVYIGFIHFREKYYSYIYRKERQHVQDGWSPELHSVSGCYISPKSTYNPIHPSVVEWIKNSGERVVEVFAGNGENAKLIREQGVPVYAYDLVPCPQNSVEYGVAGTVENNDECGILLICTGISALPSVENFKGKYIIVGGYVGSKVGGMSIPKKTEVICSF